MKKTVAKTAFKKSRAKTAFKKSRAKTQKHTLKKSAHKTAFENNDDKKKKKKYISIYDGDDGDDDKKKKKKYISIYDGDDDKKKKKKYISIYDGDDSKKKKKKHIGMYDGYDDNGDSKKKKKQTNKNTNYLLRGIVTSAYDDKQKKVENIDIEKQKKAIEKVVETSWNKLDTEDKANVVLDSMKKTLCNLRYGNFLDIDVSDRTPYWGLGIEHEMQLFHKSRSGMKNTNILFDSQESTCFLSKDPQSCCKSRPAGVCDDFTKETDAKKYGDFGLTSEELNYIKNMQWELSGRQIKSCKRPGEQSSIVRRVPILMPELISTNFSNRTIDSIAQEILDLEKHYIDIHMKNPHTKQKVDLYGPLTTHFCGSSSEILVPVHPTIHSKEYTFHPKMTDYVGSYHMTITLPHTRDIKKKDFVKMHQHMAQQLQWLEPLLLTGFFSPTQSSVGNPKYPKGSFRVMRVGWGNFAGSDVRKMGTKGLDRGSNIKSTWRKGIHFAGTKKLNYCSAVAPVQYKKSKTVHTGDFRTFGFEHDMEKCAQLYNKNDCPRADGKPMEPPFGVEIRIFDHFPAEYLIELMRIVVLVAANAQRHPAKEYVYRDSRWKKAIHRIMKEGWNANIDPKYVTALKANLGLPIHTTSTLAYDIFRQIVKELHEINKESYINRLMNKHYDVEPVVPQINRICWEMGFTQHYNTKFIHFLKRHFHNNQQVSVSEFTKLLKKDKEIDIDYNQWKNDINDVLYALETHHHVRLDIFNGKIQHVTILLP